MASSLESRNSKKAGLSGPQLARHRFASIAPASEKRSRHSTSSLRLASISSGSWFASATFWRRLQRSAWVPSPVERFDLTTKAEWRSSRHFRRRPSASMKSAARRSASRLRRDSRHRQRWARWPVRALRRREINWTVCGKYVGLERRSNMSKSKM